MPLLECSNSHVTATTYPSLLLQIFDYIRHKLFLFGPFKFKNRFKKLQCIVIEWSEEISLANWNLNAHWVGHIYMAPNSKNYLGGGSFHIPSIPHMLKRTAV